MSDLFHDQLQAQRWPRHRWPRSSFWHHTKVKNGANAFGGESRLCAQPCRHIRESRAYRLTGTKPAAIHPWIVGDEQGAIDLARSLQSEGFLGPGHPISDRCERLGSAPDHRNNRARGAANSRILRGIRAPRGRLLETLMLPIRGFRRR